jgi:uncharacterized membrane protein
MRRLGWIFMILGIVGALDAGYLTLKHYTRTPLGCSLLAGCDKVTTSEYAEIAGIPVALLGLAYYLAIAGMAGLHIARGGRRAMAMLIMLSPVGFAASIWFVYLQVAVIGALCAYCIASAATSTGILIVGAYSAPKFFDI